MLAFLAWGGICVTQLGTVAGRASSLALWGFVTGLAAVLLVVQVTKHTLQSVRLGPEKSKIGLAAVLLVLQACVGEWQTSVCGDFMVDIIGELRKGPALVTYIATQYG